MKNYKDSNADFSRQLQRASMTIESMRAELTSFRKELDSKSRENAELAQSLKQTREHLTGKIEEMAEYHIKEKNCDEEKINELVFYAQTLEKEICKEKRDKDRAIREYEVLSEALKVKVAHMIQESIENHMKQLAKE